MRILARACSDIVTKVSQRTTRHLYSPRMFPGRSWLVPILVMLGLMLSAASLEHRMGRRLWGVPNTPGIWSGDIWSRYNSQFVSDPYSFTHVTHGVVFYGLSTLLFPKSSLQTRLMVAVAAESAWEVLENSDAVINRYRTETISLEYFGDSIVNSMSDILFCITGFFIASRLPKRATIAGTVALEVILALWIRDNLTLNIIMLVFPIDAVKAWQMGIKGI
jgi:hypothetical protein